MKKTILIVALAAVTISAQSVLAQQAKPAENDTQTQQMAPNPAEFDKQLAQVQENMKQMQAQMEKISQAQNPQERQQLLQQHWTTMHDAMGMMRGMGGPGGMGCCMGGAEMGQGMMGGPMMGWGRMQDYYSKLTPEQQKQRQYMTDQYLRMQQMMMDHMMQHQYWMGQPQPAPK